MKQELETLIVPLIFLLAMIVISYVMYKEDKPKTIVTVDDIVLTDEQVGQIEKAVQHAVKHYKPHWKMQYRGHFNTAQYVKYLEYKASKG